MITVEINLIPYGHRLYGETLLGKMVICSSPDNLSHQYFLIDNNDQPLKTGSIVKEKSGHRNPFHLLRNILNDVDLGDLEDNYITTSWDKSHD